MPIALISLLHRASSIIARHWPATGERAAETLGGMDQEGYWEAAVIENGKTRIIAEDSDYDQALAEIGDDIAHRADINPIQRDEILELISEIPDCHEFDDLEIRGKTYMIREVGPALDASVTEAELKARFEAMMEASRAELGHCQWL